MQTQTSSTSALQLPAKSYDHLSYTFLKYGSGLIAGYGVWTAFNKIDQVKVGTVLNIFAGIAGLIIFSRLNKEKTPAEEKPVQTKSANSNDTQRITVLEAKNAMIEQRIAALEKNEQDRINEEKDKKIKELQKTIDDLKAWNPKLKIPLVSPTKETSHNDKRTTSQEDKRTGASRRGSVPPSNNKNQNPLLRSAPIGYQMLRSITEDSSLTDSFKLYLEEESNPSFVKQVTNNPKNEGYGRGRGSSHEPRSKKQDSSSRTSPVSTLGSPSSKSRKLDKGTFTPQATPLSPPSKGRHTNHSTN